MACYHPLYAYRDPVSKEIRFLDKRFEKSDSNLLLPCGQCVGCRLERSRQWAIRIMHEASLYENNSFLTLTYNQANLPDSLDYSDFQLFMKRLRKHFPQKIRFYMCGEYGESFQRPHFHACVFNCDFPDKKFWKRSNGNPIYVSETLEKLWPFGYSYIGSLTFKSAAYVSRYVMKKITGDQADEHYLKVDEETGEVIKLTPEFNKMSLKPGIGQGWIEKYQSDVYPNDYVVINGRKSKPPRYYDKKVLDLPENLNIASDVEYSRFLKAEKYAHDNTDERLAVKEKLTNLKLKKLKRSFES